MKLVLILTLLTINWSNSALIYQFDGRVYYISYPIKVDWYESVRFCIRNGMYLVEVYDEMENNIILSVMKSIISENKLEDGNFWIGGTNYPSSEQFYWASTGYPFVYTNWVETTNETNSAFNCVYYDNTKDHKWNVIECEEKLFFICRDTYNLPVYKSRECSIK